MLSRRTAVQRLGAAGVAAVLIEGTRRKAATQAATPGTVAAFEADGWAAAMHDYSVNNLGAFGEDAGRFTVRVATIFQLDGDLIRFSADYYDIHAILAQLSTPATPTAN